MTAKTLSRAAFAALAGVNRSTVTRLCGTLLKGSTVGNRIDPDHPDSVAYLETRVETMTEPTTSGLDPLHEQALSVCQESGYWSISRLQRELKIGYTRASRMLGVMREMDLVPESVPKPKIVAPTQQAPESRTPRYMRGGEAKSHNKKTEALEKLTARLAGEPDPFAQVAPVPGSEDFEIPEDIRLFVDMTLRQLLTQFGTEEAFCTWLKASKEIEAVDEKRTKNAKAKGELVTRRLVETGVIDVYDSAHLRLLSDGAKTIAAGMVAKHASGAELFEIEDYVADTLGAFIRPIKNKIKRALKSAG